MLHDGARFRVIPREAIPRLIVLLDLYTVASRFAELRTLFPQALR